MKSNEYINMSFLLDKELHEEFNILIKKNNLKNLSNAINVLVENYLNEETFTVIEKKDKKLYGFNVKKEINKDITYYSNNTKELDNNTDLIKKVMTKYIKENR